MYFYYCDKSLKYTRDFYDKALLVESVLYAIPYEPMPLFNLAIFYNAFKCMCLGVSLLLHILVIFFFF